MKDTIVIDGVEYIYEVVYSPDDNGYYAEVWDDNGRDVLLHNNSNQTAIHPTARGAEREVKRLIASLLSD